MIDVTGELALEVGSLVLGDGLLGSEAVEHGRNLDVNSLSFSLVSHCTKFAHGVAGILCIITVAEAAALRLTNSLKGGFMVCHYKKLWIIVC